MAAAHVQLLGSVVVGSAAATTTVIVPSSKTVTAGNTIVVGWGCYYAGTPTGVADNLGNTYVHIERTTRTGSTADLWYAPVTVGGSITAITVTHDSRAYRLGIASEFSGVDASSAAAGAGGTGSGTTGTWMTNKTIPASGLAVGVMKVDGASANAAGAASGSPSTSISESGELDDAPNGMSLSLDYALAGASSVTSFTGTTTWTTSQAWAGAGGLFNPAAAAAVSPNFIPFFWA